MKTMDDFEMTCALVLAQMVADGNYDADILLAALNKDVEKAKQIAAFLNSVSYKHDYVKLALNKLYLEITYKMEERKCQMKC